MKRSSITDLGNRTVHIDENLAGGSGPLVTRAQFGIRALKTAANGYSHASERLEATLVELLKCTRSMGGPGTYDVPFFALPPKEIMLIGGLDDVGLRAARNDSARELVKRACNVPMRDMPTIAMLRAVLERHNITIGEATLADLGITAGQT